MEVVGKKVAIFLIPLVGDFMGIYPIFWRLIRTNMGISLIHDG